MSIEKIRVPDIGGVDDAEVIEICVAIGDTVAIDDSLVVLESEKASMEVPSPVAGKIVAINIAEGDTLSEGDFILELEVGNSTVTVENETPSVESDSQVHRDSSSKGESSSESDRAKLSGTGVGLTDDSMLKSVESIAVPDLGGADNVEVIEICVEVGDVVAEGESLVVLESDKASMEIPSPKSGTVLAILVKETDIVSEGMPLMSMECATSSLSKAFDAGKQKIPPQQHLEDLASSKTVASESSEVHPPSVSEAPLAKEKFDQSTASKPDTYAGPAVRRLAREMGVVLDSVKGTGPRARITKNDLKGFVKNALASKGTGSSKAAIPAIPEVDFSKFGEITIEPLSKIAKLTAANMQRNWLNVPHVTQFDDADITDLEDFRSSLKNEAKQRDTKITPMPFLLKACAAALKENPKFNASLNVSGDALVLKKYIHIGVAVDTPAGLVVPVVRDVDKKSIWDLAEETAELAEKAKNRKLTPLEMQGSCFTISSLGNIGGNGFTPIVNAPEVGILGVSKLQTKPVWDGAEFVPRKMLPLAISYDHRVINGVDAGRFFTYLVEVLADIRRLVL